MYRVLLKVDKVNLRIKQNIRKNQKHFNHSKKQTLFNGEITLTNSSQFFINPLSPSFTIEIYLIMGSIKKRGGIVQINLGDYQSNASHRIRAPIQQIPIKNCTLDIDFVYMQSSKFYEGQDIVSLQEIQNFDQRQYLQLISKQNQQLTIQKNRLNNQIKLLRQKNQSLAGETSMINKTYQSKKIQLQTQIQSMEQQKETSYENLEMEKRKIAEIVDMVNQSGNYELISQVEEIIHHNNQNGSFLK